MPPASDNLPPQDEEADEEDERRGASAMPLKKRMALAAAEEEEDEASESVEFDDGYGSDFYGDETDRARLNEMNDLDREQILFERSERRQEALERRRVKQEARARTSGAHARKPPPRARAPAARGSKAGKEAALEVIKAQRERQAGQRADQRVSAARRRAEEAVRRAERGGEESASASEGEERGGGWGRGGGRGGRSASPSSDSEEDVALAGFSEIMRCVLSRSQLEKWADKPFFDDTVRGCFVRIGTGAGADGQPLYRMAQVRDVLNGVHASGAELRAYEFGRPAGRRTAKWLLLRHGEQERAFKMAMVSNAQPLEREFQGWARAEMACSRRPLRLSDVKAREAAILGAASYRWDSADVARMLAEKRSAAGGGPRNAVLDKERLLARLQVCEQEGDAAGAADCREQLEECEQALASLPRGAQAMGSINRRNAAANVEILDAHAREVGAQAQRGAGKAGSDVDPFSRRPTRVTNYWQTKGAQEAPAAAPTEAAPAETPEAATQAGDGEGEGEGLEAADPRLLPASGPAEHPLAAAHKAAWRPIDLSRCAGPRTLPLLQGWTGGLGCAEEAIRSGKTLITIGEYKKRVADAQREAQMQARPPLPAPPPLPPPPQQQWY